MFQPSDNPSVLSSVLKIKTQNLRGSLKDLGGLASAMLPSPKSFAVLLSLTLPAFQSSSYQALSFSKAFPKAGL